MTLFCVQVSGNHRLDDNKKEKERIKKQGFEVSSSKVEGRPTGPLRVWPGGLAMGRSLGDYEVPVACPSVLTHSAHGLYSASSDLGFSLYYRVCYLAVLTAVSPPCRQGTLS